MTMAMAMTMTMMMVMAMTMTMAMATGFASSEGAERGDAAAISIEKVELRMENVSKSYGGWQVVDAVSMSVGHGEVVGVLRPKGAEMSTAFNIMVGWERPCGGAVFLGPLDITMLSLSLPHRARLGIGYRTQESSIFQGLSVHDNIRLILQETGVPRAQHAQRVQELLEKFAVQVVENTVGRALSRAELPRALASDGAAGGGPPKILLVDEPFAGVAEMQKQLRRLYNEEGMGDHDHR